MIAVGRKKKTVLNIFQNSISDTVIKSEHLNNERMYLINTASTTGNVI